MITVTLLGMDIYQAIPLTKELHKTLVKIYDIPDNQLNFYAGEGFLIHNGVEQTAFRLDIKIEAPEQFDSEDIENDVKDALLAKLKDIAIHFHLTFTYFNPEHDYVILEDGYPEYMTESNTIKAKSDEDEMEDEDEDEEYQEPYMGDIIGEFDKFVKDHPNASNEEIYDALMGIREEVTESHHHHHHLEDSQED